MSMYIMLDVFDMMTEILGEKENQKQKVFLTNEQMVLGKVNIYIWKKKKKKLDPSFVQ